MVLLNGRDEVLVFRHIGERRSYWVLPGGEVGEGESWVEAAAREMWEERGISGVPIGPLLWTRRAPGHQNRQALISDERDDLVRCGMQEVTNTRQLAEEKRISTAQPMVVAGRDTSLARQVPPGATCGPPSLRR